MRRLFFKKKTWLRLPSALRRPFSHPVDRSVIRDFSEFSQIPLDEIERRIARHCELNASDWTGQDFNNPADFYIKSNNYIFDTLSANPGPDAVTAKLDRFNPLILTKIRHHRGKRLLDFGGGVGAFCEIASRMGKDVTYIDLPGIVFDFARWRFHKMNMPVQMIAAKPGAPELAGRYDIIYTDAVIGHFKPEDQLSVVLALADAVAPGGLLILLIDLAGPTSEKPMIYPVDVQRLHAALKNFSCEFGNGLWLSMWQKTAL